MCGIAGYIGKVKQEASIIKASLQSMENRGPDFQHAVNFKIAETYIYLLHARLGIIDLDARSNQPFTIEHATIVFNGEIYNYIELKEELIKRGIRLKTQSDTEVLLHYYLIYGEDCVRFFEGMWSFAIYDSKKQNLFLSRDRFGEKPLYIYQSNDGIYFASETSTLKIFAKQNFSANKRQLLRYLVNGHKSIYKHQETFYNEVTEIDLATNVIIPPNLSTRVSKYWKPSFSMNSNLKLADAIDQTREHLIRTTKLRLRSDVPLAFCLSGGVDSAGITSIAAKELNYDVSSFSIIDTDARYNELDNIQATINDTGCKNVKVKLDPKANYLEHLKELVRYHDAPVSTISYFVHSLLIQEMNERGYKISISGTGADEIFTGYYDHFNLHLYEMRNLPNFDQYVADWKKYPASFVRNPDLQNPQLYFDNENYREHIYLNNDLFSSMLNNSFKESFIEENYTPSLLRNRMLNELFHEVVRVILHEDDLNSMMYSIENRSPFLDSKLVEFAYSIPHEHLIKNGYAKYILREALSGILNDTVRLSREKKGFNASINSIIDFENPQHIDFILDDSAIFEVVNKQKIEQFIKQKDFPNSYKKFLFNFINAKIFLEN